ncbi:MAG: 2-C-methyl-D-erythritol 2,4-cyclodiphosphate synthase [Pseudomonadota bacterium]
MTMKIGHGYDAHRFGGDSPLILGGVSVPHHCGLLAHSDGDVVIHAVCDAILGALGLGDIGKHFPDNDPQFKGVDSRELLRQVVKQMLQQHFTLGNLDITIVAQTPKLAAYIEDMARCLSDDCQARRDVVNVKATTTEKMGFVGREEGIGVHAVVLLQSILE